MEEDEVKSKGKVPTAVPTLGRAVSPGQAACWWAPNSSVSGLTWTEEAGKQEAPVRTTAALPGLCFGHSLSHSPFHSLGNNSLSRGWQWFLFQAQSLSAGKQNLMAPKNEHRTAVQE